MGWVLLSLCGWFGCALFVHLRGRERLRLRRQLTDHSTFTAPYNAFIYFFSAVPRGPYLDALDFDELAPLRDNWKVIREEALRLYQGGQIQPAEHYDDVAFNSFFKRGWKRFYLKWYGAILPSAEAHCPATVEIVRSIPSLRAALITLMPPRSRTGKHRDPFAGSLRYHLALATPNDDACRIYVDGTSYSWRDGEGVVFDQTFVHRAVNDTDEPRIILFCDFDRSLTTRFARAVNRFMADRVAVLTAARNRDNEPLGFVNHFSGRVHRLGMMRADFKCRHPIGYQLARALVVAALVGLVVFAMYR